MAYQPDITAELLRQLISLDKDTGSLFWKERGPEFFGSLAYAKAWNTRYANKPLALDKNSNGYLRITLLGKTYLAHRAVFAVHHGFLPETIDHINKDRSDNRLENLRAASYAENNRNVGISKANTSGFKGVQWSKSRKRWRSVIWVDQRAIHLGFFDDKQKAVQAYAKANAEHHKAFGRVS